MSVNGWRILLIVVVLQSLIILLAKAGQGQAGSCFSSSFSRAIGYILRGFLIGEMKVSTVIECKRRCVIGANCLSLNILTNADGRFVCQLNSERKESGVKEQFVPHGAGEYYGLKEKKLCEDNGKSCDSATPWHAFDRSYFKLVDSPLNFHDAMKFCRAEKGDLVSISSKEEQTYLYKTFSENTTPWHAFNQSYFKLVDSPLNFHDAMKFCRAEKGDLASISSKEEQTYLYKTFLENTDLCKWVGLNDIAEEGVYVWTDGSPVSYISFDPTQPDTRDGEDCIVLSKFVSGGLRDANCMLIFPFICETNYSLMFA